MPACFNPFKVNGISHSSQLDQSISILGLLGGIFHFHSNFNGTFCAQTVETLIRHCILQCLIWVCTVFMSHIKDARLTWVNWLKEKQYVNPKPADLDLHFFPKNDSSRLSRIRARA